MNLDQQRELISIYKQYQETNTNTIKANIAAKMQELSITVALNCKHYTRDIKRAASID